MAKINLTLLALAFGWSAACAQPVPKITSLSTEWVQRGATAEVTFAGENLAGVGKVLFSGERGLTATITTAKKIKTVPAAGKKKAPPADRLTARLAIAMDAPLGPREVRVAGPNGVSNPLILNVSSLPEISETKTNTALDQAQGIELPAGISGKILEMGQSDFYEFRAQKGQQLIFDVTAARNGSTLDSTLVLLDAAGKELARNEDANGLDSLLEFTPPADGEYVLQVRDFRYQGGATYGYHLTAGAVPHLDGIFPFGGRRGTKVDLVLRGRNLDGPTFAHEIPKSAPLGQQDFRAVVAQGVSNPLPFDVGDLPELLEANLTKELPAPAASAPAKPTSEDQPGQSESAKAKPAARPKKSAGKKAKSSPFAPATTVLSDKAPTIEIAPAATVSVPSVINGCIAAPKESDAYRFKAAKNQTLVFEVLASRFGSPLDALLTLSDAQGKILQQNDDAAGADARIQFKFADAGEYVVAVRDLVERGGEDFGYRLAIKPPAREADFEVIFFPDAPRLGRGGQTTVRAEVTRKGGFAGDVRVTLENPPPGVSSAPLVIPATANSGHFVITAADNAPLGNFPLKLSAKGTLSGQLAAREAEPVIVGQPAAGRRRARAAAANDRPVEEAFLTILPAQPFTLELLTLTARLEQNASTTIDVQAARRKGFMGDIEISADGFIAGRDTMSNSIVIPPVTLKSNQSRATLNVKAKVESELGTRDLILRASAVVDGQTNMPVSRVLSLTVTEIPFTVTNSLPRLSLTAQPSGMKTAAGEAVFTVKAGRRGWFTDEIKLQAEGLPAGIEVTAENIPARTEEATFKLTATDKAEIGKTNKFTIVGSAELNGREYRQSTAAISLVVNAPEAMETAPAKSAAK